MQGMLRLGWMMEIKMRTVVISKSNRPAKKFKADVNGKTVHFGAKGYAPLQRCPV